jgi:glycosyltransferase involved in cell wall biosynthesis
MGRGLRSALDEFRPGLLHAFGSRAVPAVAQVAREAPLPYVVTVNEPHLFCPTSIGRDRAGRDCLGCRGLRRLRAIVEWRGGPGPAALARAGLFWLYSYPHMAHLARSVRRASAFLPISRGLARDLVRLGYPPDRVRVVPNPIRVPAEVPAGARAALGISRDARVLMYAGRLVEEKGLQNVLRAMPALPDTTLVVLGRGRHEPALRAEAAALGLGTRVRFLGTVANEALGPYYAAADVVVMAGVFYEALGRMLMEACAHGVPVIGTNVGGIPDVIEDGRNGFLLRGQDREELCGRIRAILDSPGRAREMGAYGREKMARDFSPERCAGALLAAYRFALDEPGPAAPAARSPAGRG